MHSSVLRGNEIISHPTNSFIIYTLISPFFFPSVVSSTLASLLLETISPFGSSLFRHPPRGRRASFPSPLSLVAWLLPRLPREEGRGSRKEKRGKRSIISPYYLWCFAHSCFSRHHTATSIRVVTTSIKVVATTSTKCHHEVGHHEWLQPQVLEWSSHIRSVSTSIGVVATTSIRVITTNHEDWSPRVLKWSPQIVNMSR